MPFNNRKLNSVPLYGKEVNISRIGRSWQNYTVHTMHFQWAKTCKIAPSCGIVSPTGGLSHSDRQHAQKIW